MSLKFSITNRAARYIFVIFMVSLITWGTIQIYRSFWADIPPPDFSDLKLDRIEVPPIARFTWRFNSQIYCRDPSGPLRWRPTTVFKREKNHLFSW